MFSSSGFGGFGQQNQQQQNQQQQPTGGLFGQQQQQPQNPAPGGFGSTGFGSSGGFGAAQQPAQTGGGLFGQPAQQPAQTSTFGGNSAGGFGSFGARPATSTAFGGAQPPATQSFTFGANNANRPQQQSGTTGGFGGSTFGAPATGGGLFGQTQQQQQPAQGAFGAQTNTFGQPAQGAGQITQGTASVPYDPFREDMTPTEHIKDRKAWEVHQSITAIPAYGQYSVEELRLMDYQQGRSKGNVGPGAPGATGTGFGFGASGSGTTGGAFGQPQQPATGGFGQSSTTGGGLFGQPQQQQPAGGLFGQQNNQQQSGGLFGAKPATTGFGSTPATGGGLFGQQNNQPQQSGGLFGQPAQQQQSTTGFSFGANNNQQQQQPASTGFTFGSNNNQQQNKPAFGFGASTSTPAQTGSTGFGFGNNNNQQQQQPAQASTGFGGASGGFSFGAPKPATGGLFGGSTGQQGQTGATNTFGGFGGASAAGTQQNKPAFSFGGGATGFGGTSNAGTGTTAAPASGGLFGAAPSQPSGGLFGGGNTAGTNTGTTGGFSFGAPNNQQQGQQPATGGFGSGGLFGAKPAGQTGTQPSTGGLFGNTGGQAGQQQTGTGFGASTGGGGLFGNTANKPATGGFSFGSGGGSSLFGNTQQNQQQNQQQNNAGGLGAGFGQNQSGGLFGQNNQQGQTGATGGGLFGNNTGGSSLFGGGGSNTGGGLFGSSNQNQSGGMFGGLGQNQQNNQQQGMLQQQQQQPSVQASLDLNPYGTDNLFAANPVNGQNGAAGAPLPFNVAPKNKPPLITPFRSSPRAATKINRLRGSTPGASGLSNGFLREGTPTSFREGTPGSHARFGTPGRAGSPALFKGLSDEYSQPLSSQAFVSRPSAKRLVLDDANDNSFTVSRIGRSGSVPNFEGNSPAAGTGSAFRSGTALPSSVSSASRVTFSPALEQRAESVRPGGGDLSFASSLPSRRGNFFANASSVVDETPLKTVSAAAAKAAIPRQGKDLESSFARSAAPSVSAPAASGNGVSADSAKAGEYYTEPSLSALRTANFNELAAVHNFIVGRKGVGRIEFLDPVDLTSIGDLNDIVGGVVQIRLKEVVVYPEEEDYDPRNPKDGARRNFVPGLKAEQGTGLNVPARVSLEACWPVDRATREPIKDADHPRVKQMVNKLRNKPETEFVDFEPATGTWTFKVKHFSRYGLDDSDDDEDAAPASKLQKGSNGTLERAAPSAAVARRAPAAIEEEDSEEEDVEDDDDAPPPLRDLEDETADSDMGLGESLPEHSPASSRARRRPAPPTATSRADSATPSVRGATPSRAMSALGSGAEARRVQVMQASFFGQDDSRVASAAVVSTPATAEATTNARRVPRAPHNLKRPASDSRAKQHETSDSDTKVGEKPVVPAPQKPIEVAEPAKKLRKTDLSRSSARGAEGETLDAGLSLGRSFRVGWGPDGTLVHNGKLVGTSSSGKAADDAQVGDKSTATLTMQKLEVFSDAAATEKEAKRAELLLNVQLKHTIVDVDDDGVPVAYTNYDTRFRDFASSFEHKDRSFEACLWRLGVALFDEIDLHIPEGSSTSAIESIKNLRRKAALSNWLRHTVAGTVEAESRSHIAASRKAALLFTYLTGNQVERAATAALDAGDVRLATLIAQAGGDEETRADVSEQLLTWRKEGVDAHITKEHRKIYELLSGNVLVSKGSDSRTTRDPIDQVGDLHIAEGLDWKRAFGLFLWYESPFEASLKHSFERYESQISGQIAPPLPGYRESSSLGAARHKQLLQKPGGYDRDALFEMLKLYADRTHALEPALNACGFGASNSDARLPWHLYNLLSRVIQVRDFGDRVELGLQDEEMQDSLGRKAEGNSPRADNLASFYATQLELLGLWQWSAFVLLHLELGESREASIKALLSRHVDQHQPLEHSLQEFLCDQLRIPKTWIYEARAYAARSADNRYVEYEMLLKAQCWTAAHTVACRHLAPEAIIRGDHEAVSALFSPFYTEQGQDPADEVPGWMDGAAVYLDYVAASREIPVLVAQLNQLRHSPDEAARHAVLGKLDRYAERLPTLSAGLDRVFPPQASSKDGLVADAPGALTAKVARTEMVAGLTNLSRTLLNLSALPHLRDDQAQPVAAITAKLLAHGAAPARAKWDPAQLEVESLHSAAHDYLGTLLHAHH